MGIRKEDLNSLICGFLCFYSWTEGLLSSKEGRKEGKEGRKEGRKEGKQSLPSCLVRLSLMCISNATGFLFQ